MAKRKRTGLVDPSGRPLEPSERSGAAIVALTERKTPGAWPAMVKAQPTAESFIERAALNKDFDADKFGKLLQWKREEDARNAKTAFELAFNRMREDLPVITKRGEIKVRVDKRDVNNRKMRVQSRFARYAEDILVVVMPILARHGFTLRHKTDYPKDYPGCVRVTGLLTACGHTETSEFISKMDASDYRTDNQSWGSTISFGKRYTTDDLLSLIKKGIDNDGASGPTTDPDEEQGRVHEPEAARPTRVHEPEVMPATSTAGPPDSRERPSTTDGKVISPGMAARIFAIAKAAGRNKREVGEWLAANGWRTAEDVTRDRYNWVCRCIESRAPLPGVSAGHEDLEPGSRG